MLRWLPENVSTYGPRIDSLFNIIYVITGVIFLLVTLTLLAFLVLYRRREGVRATYTHGSQTLEVIWTLVPAAILVVLTVISYPVWRDIKMTFPECSVHVKVIGKQFNWRMIYPGPDGKYATADDLELANDLNVPVNQNIEVLLESDDVIHSFFLPNLRLKQDALPGRTIRVWFNATKPGNYEIACAELCGFGHGTMRGEMTVHTPEEYEVWKAKQWPAAAPQAAADTGAGGPLAGARTAVKGENAR